MAAVYRQCKISQRIKFYSSHKCFQLAGEQRSPIRKKNWPREEVWGPELDSSETWSWAVNPTDLRLADSLKSDKAAATPIPLSLTSSTKLPSNSSPQLSPPSKLPSHNSNPVTHSTLSTQPSLNQSIIDLIPATDSYCPRFFHPHWNS